MLSKRFWIKTSWWQHHARCGLLALPVVWPATYDMPALAGPLDYRSPDAVPAAWMRYAQLVQYELMQRLSADGDQPYRLHVFLENRAVAADPQMPPETSTIVS